MERPLTIGNNLDGPVSVETKVRPVTAVTLSWSALTKLGAVCELEPDDAGDDDGEPHSLGGGEGLVEENGAEDG